MASKAKNAQQLARQLFKMSVVDGVVSSERVAGVIEYISAHKLAEPVLILKAYRRYVITELAKSNAVVEHAGALSDSVLGTIAAALTQKYGHTVSTTARPNPALIAGIKVLVADDVYESSIAGQLSALASAV